MSHNIYIKGYPDFPWQIPTFHTRTILEKANGSNAIAFELISKWVHENYDPPELTGKDSRNKFLINRRNNDIKLLNDRLKQIRTFLLTAPHNSVGST